MSYEKDPGVGRYEYRGGRFEVQRNGEWGYFRYYVAEVQLPWDRGGLIALCHEAGWFSWTAKGVIRKIMRAVDKEYRRHERNGKPTHVGAALEGWDLEPLPDRHDDYRVLA